MCQLLLTLIVVEYVLFPHNEDAAKPRALNTFLEGLAEPGVNKNLIKNEKLLGDLLEKEQAYNDNESDGATSDGFSSNPLRRKPCLRQTVNSKKPKATTKLSTPTLKFKEK